MKLNKKLIVITIVCIIGLCAVVFLLNNDNSPSVTGTWKIARYEYDGISYKPSEVEDLCELRGYSLLEWSETTIKFTKSGSVYLNRKENGKPFEVSGTYTVGDAFIELCSNDGEKKLLDYDGKSIAYDIPMGVTLIFQK